MLNAGIIISALKLPAHAAVGQRVPKKILVEQGAPTTADKRQINEGIEELTWVAALKSTTIGVPEYRDEKREYLEIAVLNLALRPEAKAVRLRELVHRSIPYPILLITEQEGVTLSLAHIRFAQNEAKKMVLDGDLLSTPIFDTDCDQPAAFLRGFALAEQPRSHMLALYQGWIEHLEALQSARLTGRFTRAVSTDAAAARREALAAQARLSEEIEKLRKDAGKETQLNRRVEMNAAIKRIEAEMAAVVKKL